MKIALIPCGVCEWREQGRLLGRVALQLSAGAEVRCVQWSQRLAETSLSTIYHAPDELCKKTAQMIARRLGATTKSVEALAEVDVGLWAGLTEAQLKARFETAHRELCDAPLNVQPPDGETFSVAAERIERSVRARIRNRKKNGRDIGFVLRPLSLAMARRALEGAESSAIWNGIRADDAPVLIDESKLPALAADRR